MDAMNSMWNLDKVRAEESPNLWVMNITSKLAEGSVHKDSTVHLIVPVGNDKLTVKIPSTWIPINIGLQVPKKAIVESSDFLRGINLRFLHPITSKEAKEFFDSNPDARIEYDNVISRMSKRNKRTNDASNEPSNLPAPLETGDVEDTAVSPRLIQAIFKFKEKEINVNELASVIRTALPLNDVDTQYVLQSVDDRKIHSIVTASIAKGGNEYPTTPG